MDLLIQAGNYTKKLLTQYVTGLLISPEKKTCTKMASWLDIRHDKLYRFLSNSDLLLPVFPRLMTKIVLYFSQKEVGDLIVDDTAINKRFAQIIEGITWIYDAVHGSQKGFSVVVILWRSKSITIPIGFKCWYGKEAAGNQYFTKIALAKVLIKEYCKKIPFRHLIMDGLYFSTEMIQFLLDRHIGFEMRAGVNRVIQTKDGKKCKLKEHPRLKLMRNARAKTVLARWNGFDLYFTVHKRLDKNGDYSIVYLVSNINTDAKNHIQIYDRRWKIETVFRFMKQNLGMAQCSARSIEKQQMHFYAVFYAYTVLQYEKVKKKHELIEEPLKYFRDAKSTIVQRRINALGEFFMSVA